MSEHETIADIIAEMRIFKCRNLETGELEVCNVIANYLADRLEAAWKREKATIEKSSTVGNCAKLREALEHVAKLAREFAVGNYYVSNFPKMLLYVIQPALAAPARNCDRYSHDEALRIWSVEPENPMNGCFDVWLYTPATEQKGENNANK